MRVPRSAVPLLVGVAFAVGWSLTTRIGVKNNAADTTPQDRTESQLTAVEVVHTPVLGDAVVLLAEAEGSAIEWSDLIHAAQSTATLSSSGSSDDRVPSTVVGSPAVGDVDCDGQPDVIVGMLRIGKGGARGSVYAVTSAAHPYEASQSRRPRPPPLAAATPTAPKAPTALTAPHAWRELWRVELLSMPYSSPFIRQRSHHDDQTWCARDPAVVIVGTHSNPSGSSTTLLLPPKATRSANVVAVSRSGVVAWDLRTANPTVALCDVNFGTVVGVPGTDKVVVIHSGGVDDKLKARMRGRWRDSMRPSAVLFILDGASGRWKYPPLSNRYSAREH